MRASEPAATSVNKSAKVKPAIVCPNAAGSVTVPLTGSASVTVYDQSCNPLAGPWNVFNGVINGSPQMSATTSPAVTTGAGGVLQFSANGAPAGSSGTFKVVFAPNGTSANLPYTVGAPVTSLSFGTTTP